MKKQKIPSKFINWLLVGLVVVVIVEIVASTIYSSKGWQKDDAEDVDATQKIMATLSVELNGTTLEEMKAGTTEIKYKNNLLKVGDLALNVEVKGRGNSTWTAEKKPWQLKLDEKVDLLGLGEVKKWVILADAFDKTHLRNYTAFSLASMLGGEFTNKVQAVEVEFDGEYEGLFTLTPKIEVASGVVNLTDELGVLMEVDNLHEDEGGYYTVFGNYLAVKDAVNEDDEELLEEAVDDFMTDFNALEVAAKNGDYKAVEEVLDTRSLAIYYLVSKFTVNPDAYRSSWYFYKNGADDKIHAGPVWDFDLALANRNWGEASNEDYYAPTVSDQLIYDVLMSETTSETQKETLVYDLLEIPEFLEEVKQVFQEKMSGRGEEFIAAISAQAEWIKPAVKRDAEKWEYEGYEEETEALIEWIKARFEFFEQEYGNLAEDLV